MKSTVETLSPTRVRLSVEVPFDELAPSLAKAYRALASQINVPGFRPGKAPKAVIDQRLGRGTVLNEAVQEAIPEQYLAAVQEHEVKTLGRPEVDVTEFGDGEPLRFTAEVDVRPEITMPALDGIAVTVDSIEVSEADLAEQVEGLRARFATLKGVDRPAAESDFVQIDLAATVDGEEVQGGTASGVSHEVGSGQLLPGLDEVLVGMSAGDSTSFTTQLVGGEHAGRDADVAVTVKTVRERELPDLDDDFAQLASEFDTLDELRADLSERLAKVKRMGQLSQARDKALEALVEAADVPAPEGVVREEVNQRKQSMNDQLERIGASLEEYLDSEGKSADELDAELTKAAEEGVRIQLVLDTLAEAEQLEVTDDEYGHEIVHRAQRAGLAPDQYYQQLVRSGLAAAVYGDVRRGKALGLVLERVKITDSAGKPVSVEDLRGGPEADADEHEHEH